MFLKRHYTISLLLISLALPTYSMDSHTASSSSVDDTDANRTCADFSRKVLQDEAPRASSPKHPTQQIETIQAPLVPLPEMDRFQIGTQYPSRPFPVQNKPFTQSSTMGLGLDGDEKGLRETATEYLYRLIQGGKLASALEANPHKTIETKDPKAAARFAEALTETTNGLDTLLKSNCRTQTDLFTNQRQSLMTHTDNAELILTALTEIDAARGSISDKSVRAICAGLKKMRRQLNTHQQVTLNEFEAQTNLLASLESRVRAQHPAPSTVEPVSPTEKYTRIPEFLTFASASTTPRQMSPRSTRHALEAQLAATVARQQEHIDQLRAQEGTVSTPRTAYVQQQERK